MEGWEDQLGSWMATLVGLYTPGFDGWEHLDVRFCGFGALGTCRIASGGLGVGSDGLGTDATEERSVNKCTRVIHAETFATEFDRPLYSGLGKLVSYTYASRRHKYPTLRTNLIRSSSLYLLHALASLRPVGNSFPCFRVCSRCKRQD